MSIAAFIMEPEDLRNNEAMYTPISTEEGFYKAWYPLIQELELKWLTHMSFGLDVTKSNLQEVLSELHILSTFIEESENPYRIGLLERIANLENMLIKAFENENVVVYIG